MFEDEDEDEIIYEWLETPSGKCINHDPENGGIIDINSQGEWFIIFNRPYTATIDGFTDRDDAFDGFYNMLRTGKLSDKQKRYTYSW